MSDPLDAARARGRTHPDRELFDRVTAIIERDGNPSNQDGSISGGANEIIALCRQHFAERLRAALKAIADGQIGFFNPADYAARELAHDRAYQQRTDASK